jgi:hypothetical protein
MKPIFWQDEAIRRFPDYAEKFRGANSPYTLWNDLWHIVESAYESGDSALVGEIYAYAKWCTLQPRGETAEDDLATCVNTCFVEHIPTNKKALDDMPNWFTLEDVTRMKETFSYHVGPEGYAKVLARYRTN